MPIKPENRHLYGPDWPAISRRIRERAGRPARARGVANQRAPKSGGWVSAGIFDGGFTCCVEQGHYGHRARKATWLYVYDVKPLPTLVWGPSRACVRIDGGYHSAEERRAGKARGEQRDTEQLSKLERAATPRPFAELLVSIARTSRIGKGAA